MEKAYPYLVIIASNFATLIPHSANFSPVYGAVNFSFKKISNFILSTFTFVMTYYICHLILGYINNTPENVIYPLYGWWIVYVFPTHLINGLLSKFVIKDDYKYSRIGLTSSITSLNFFILSNFSYFIFAQDDHSLVGLNKVYVDALPFLPYQVLSNFFFTYLYFGVNDLVFAKRRVDTNLLDSNNENLIA